MNGEETKKRLVETLQVESPWNGAALGAASGGYGLAQLIQEAETDFWKRRYFEVMNKVERLTLQAFLVGVLSGAFWVGVLWYAG